MGLVNNSPQIDFMGIDLNNNRISQFLNIYCVLGTAHAMQVLSKWLPSNKYDGADCFKESKLLS